MESAHSLILHIYNVTGPCAKIATLAGEKSKWLSKVLRVQIAAGSCRYVSFQLCDQGPNLDPQAQESAINLPDKKEKIQQCSKTQGPHLRLTGLKPAYVIGRDIVISRDHLSLICHSPPLPLTLSFMLGCHCTSQLVERLNGSEPLMPPGGGFLDQ